MDKRIEGSSFEDAYVQCPYYKASSEKAILCEGADFSSTVTVRHRSRKKHRTFMTRYCEDIEAHKRCPYFRAANAKYETEGV